MKNKKERAVARKFLGLLALVCGASLFAAACGGGGDRPTCRGAIEAYYDTGCYFIDLDTQQQIAASVMISYCQDIRTVDSGLCQDALDQQLDCLQDAHLTLSCDCMDEQALVANACGLE